MARRVDVGELFADRAGAERRAENAGQTIGDPPSDPITGAQLLDTVFPPIEFAVRGWFPRSEVTEIVGGHAQFKSTLAFGACCCVATGRPWGGAETTKGRACFITMEDRYIVLQRRVRSWLESVPEPERFAAAADLRSNLLIIGRERSQNFQITQRDRYRTIPAEGGVIEQITTIAEKCNLIVLETTSRLHAGDEDNESLSVFASVLEEIATKSKASVAIVRHVSKAAARDSMTDSMIGRGGTALSDAVRSIISVKRDKPENGGEPDPYAPITMRHEKSTIGRPELPVVWRPIPCGDDVYLRPMDDVEQSKRSTDKLLLIIREKEDAGIGRDDLLKNRPKGVSRKSAEAALIELLRNGAIVMDEVSVGTKAKKKTVYWAAEFAPRGS